MTTVSLRHCEKVPVFKPSPNRPSSFVAVRPPGAEPQRLDQLALRHAVAVVADQDVGTVGLELRVDVDARRVRGHRVVDKVRHRRREVVADVAQGTRESRRRRRDLVRLVPVTGSNLLGFKHARRSRTNPDPERVSDRRLFDTTDAQSAGLCLLPDAPCRPTAAATRVPSSPSARRCIVQAGDSGWTSRCRSTVDDARISCSVGSALYVFIDGCFWHGCPEHFVTPKTRTDFWLDKVEGNRERDRDTDRRFAELGLTSYGSGSTYLPTKP